MNWLRLPTLKGNKSCTGALCPPAKKPVRIARRDPFAKDFVTANTCSDPRRARDSVPNQGTNGDGIRVAYRHPNIMPQTMWKMACVLRTMGVNAKTYLSAASWGYKRGDPRNLTLVTPRTEENLRNTLERLEGRRRPGTLKAAALHVASAANLLRYPGGQPTACVAEMKKVLNSNEVQHAKPFCSLVTKALEAHIPGFMDKYGGHLWGGAITALIFGSLMVAGWWYQNKQKHKHEGDDKCTVKIHIDNYNHVDVHMPCGGSPKDVRVPSQGNERWRRPFGEFKPHRYGYRRPYQPLFIEPFARLTRMVRSIRRQPYYRGWHWWPRYSGEPSTVSVESDSGKLSRWDKAKLFVVGALMTIAGVRYTIGNMGGGRGLVPSPQGARGLLMGRSRGGGGASIQGYSNSPGVY